MARDDNKKTILDGKAAIDLWLQGVDAWNQWVEENPVADVIFEGVDFSQYDEVSFMNYIFPKGYVNFSRAQFGEGCIDFTGAQFGEGDFNFSGALFGKGDINFSGTQFGKGDVNFSGTQFGKGNVNFSGTKFGKGDVNFSGSQFDKGDAIFAGAHFVESKVYFGSIKLSGQFNFWDVIGTEKISSLSFKFSTFEGPVCLDKNNFNCIPDFTNTKLSHQLSLSHFTVSNSLIHKSNLIPKSLTTLKKLWFGSELKYSQIKNALNHSKKLSRRFPWLSKLTAADTQDIDRLRRLKELAESNKHYKLALDLHVEEMKSSRWIETTSKRSLFTEFLFQKFGDYGRSILRPLTSLVLLWLVCAPIYASASNNKEISLDALLFSFSQMFSIIPSSRDARSESSTALYGTLIDGKLIVDVPHVVFAIAGLQSLTSIILVFLVGLALRNRFRI
ncbi:hypothetical protein J8M21_11310 [Pseudoalteromonas luteoviolacea]|uniref:pentapeptide repeat-containing protein n=1 Tax=Pseudoalteromonas luteoviolacea TaxID=43657 RepID=UPI001B39E57D|nr:pentapeptide repeat-containing protein [Pseudoalteromonas luteoviolacea]MBQ4877796.1 hypothetical protein [Pseudoalteromonas luteoviolacea]MBQ4906758.1 hypothetical protein [Pseudoalteromonas luteoviolacea]